MYAKLAASFERKRNRAYPAEIRDVILDLDGTLFPEDAAVSSLKKMKGRMALTALRHPIKFPKLVGQLKKELKNPENNQKKKIELGTEWQKLYGWKRKDWTKLADEMWENHDRGIAEALKSAQKEKQDLRIHVVSGTSNDYAKRVKELLEEHYGLRIHSVVGSEQTAKRGNRIEGVRVTITKDDVPKQTVIERILARKYPQMKWKNTLVLEDSNPQIMLRAGIGVLVPNPSLSDQETKRMEPHKLYDAIAKNPQARKELVSRLILNPREAIKLHQDGKLG